jgi:hypothetical protein
LQDDPMVRLGAARTYEVKRGAVAEKPRVALRRPRES